MLSEYYSGCLCADDIMGIICTDDFIGFICTDISVLAGYWGAILLLEVLSILYRVCSGYYVRYFFTSVRIGARTVNRL